MSVEQSIKDRIAQAASTASAEQLAYLAVAVDSVCDTLGTPSLLADAVYAVKSRITAAAGNATPEDLAYLGTAIDRIGGSATVLDVRNMGDTKIAEITAHASLVETTTLESIGTAADVAVVNVNTTKTAAEASVTQTQNAALVVMAQTEISTVATVNAAAQAAIDRVATQAPEIAALVRSIRRLDQDPFLPRIVESPVASRVLTERHTAVSGDLEVTGDYWIAGTQVIVNVPIGGALELCDLIEADTRVDGALVASNGTLTIAPWATLTLGAEAMVNAVDLPRTLII